MTQSSMRISAPPSTNVRPKLTRKAAFSALLALVEAGVVAGETAVSSTARGMSDPGLDACQNAGHGLIFAWPYRFAFRELIEACPMPSVLATRSLISLAYLDHLYRVGGGPCRHGRRRAGLPFECHRPAVRRKPGWRRRMTP
jgi:hypothetical protein